MGSVWYALDYGEVLGLVGFVGSSGNGGKGGQALVGVVESGEAMSDVRRVSGACPEVAKVVVAGGDGSEGEVSGKSAGEEMTQWQAELLGLARSGWPGVESKWPRGR